MSTGTLVGNNSADSRFLAMDVNGDGKTDVVELYGCGIIPRYYCRATWLSNGTAFTLASSDPGIGFSADRQFLNADVNGDGKADLIEIYPTGLGGGGRHIWLSNGTGFVSGTTDTGLQFSAPDGNGAGSRFVVMDVNGDDKADMVELYPFLAMYTRRTWISTGYGYTLGSTDSSMGSSANTRQLVADVNGDHRDDLIELSPYGLSTQRQIWFSNGAGFTAGPTDTGIGQFSCSKGACTSEFFEMDVNGDGLGEMTELYNTNFSLSKGRHVWKIGGAVPDLLTSKTNEWGATTSVGYTPSSAWANTNNPPLVQTASAVTVGDGRGSTATTKYSFAGGAFDRVEREPQGFRSQRETEPCIAGETACPTTDTTFRQDLASVGQPERRERRTGAGMLLGATVQDFTTDNVSLPRTSLLTGTWDYSYAGDGTACPGADCKRKHTTQQYNAYGEVTQKVEYGDNEATGDERTTATTFVPNPSAYLVNKPASVTKYQGAGTTGAKLTETLNYYDGATTNQAPTAGLESRSSKWLSTSNTYADSRTEYDEWGNITALVDPLGARTTLTWDPTYHQFQTAEKNPLAQQVDATWDAGCGAPTLVRKPGNLDTTVTYDALCRRAEMTEPGGKFERYTWVNQGNAATQYEQTERPAADGSSTPRWTRLYFDGLQRTWRTAQQGPNAATGDIFVDTAFNQRGKEASKTAEYYWVAGQPQPTTQPTVTSYDALDRITKVAAPGGGTQTKSYGLWSTTETDERGHATTARVDAYDKRIASTETIGGAARTATYVFDGRDDLVRSTDPDGNVIAYTRDSLGNATRIVDPDNGTTTYEWDAGGRLVAQTDAKNQRTTFGYDALGRKTTQTSKAGTASAVNATWTYDQVRAGYNNIGKLTTLTDSAGTRTSNYDAAGRIVKTVRTINGTAYTFQYGFDAGDRALWTIYPDGFTVGTAADPIRYDGAGRELSIPGFVSAARYSAAGELIGLDNTNGTVTARTVDAQRGWLTGIQTKAGSTTVQDDTYTRDAKGNVTKVASPSVTSTYGYDEAGQLTSTTGADSQTVGYDETGNITTNSDLGAYTYGATRPHAVTGAGSNSYAYDAAGLMTSGAGRTLTWDGENRLASVTKAGATTTFTYDGEGARIQSVEGTTTHRYLGDDYEVDVTSGTATKYISIAGQLVARADGTTKYWVHTDQQGSIQAVTDASGNEVKRKQYAAFGAVTSATGSLARETRGFTGQRQEDATGLLYLHSRYYDPELGRFVSPNPIIDGEDTIGLNRYVYAANNPVNNADKTGLDCTKGDAKCDRMNWDHEHLGHQQKGWSCGPAAVRVALSAQGVYFEKESDLYGPLNTDEDGTDSIGGNVVPYLNAKLNTTFYESKAIPGSTADQEHIDQLKADIVTDINANRPIVANVTVGARDIDGDLHAYPGHYVTVVGYDQGGALAHIYDAADVNRVYNYWMSTDNLATWIAGKGYAG